MSYIYRPRATGLMWPKLTFPDAEEPLEPSDPGTGDRCWQLPVELRGRVNLSWTEDEPYTWIDISASCWDPPNGVFLGDPQIGINFGRAPDLDGTLEFYVYGRDEDNNLPPIVLGDYLSGLPWKGEDVRFRLRIEQTGYMAKGWIGSVEPDWMFSRQGGAFNLNPATFRSVLVASQVPVGSRSELDYLEIVGYGELLQRDTFSRVVPHGGGWGLSEILGKTWVRGETDEDPLAGVDGSRGYIDNVSRLDFDWHDSQWLPLYHCVE